MNPGQNATWIARSLQSVWHPCTQMKHHSASETALPLVPLARAQGVWLYDHEGRRYLDGISSWWVNLFGHANPDINAALKAQLDTLEHAMLAGFTHAPVVELSERLSAMTGGVLGHAFYASDGASAIEIALKMSFHYWRNRGQSDKREFICLKNSYHGETLGALSVTDVPLFRDAYDSLLRHAHVVSTPDARLAGLGETAADVAQRAAAELETLLQQRHGQIAALIIEPLVQCAAGMAMYDPSYLHTVRRLCDRYHIHLIADEIAVGCGRTGSFFASEQAREQTHGTSSSLATDTSTTRDTSVWPDFLTLSKGISGGYLPLSLVLTRDAIYQAFYDDQTARGFLHSHSYTGNALACRAALATLDLFDRHDVLATNRTRAARIAADLAPLASHPRVAHLRQCGMIFAFDVRTEDPGFSRRFFRTALDHELLLRPIGNTVYLMPPYVLDEAELALLTERTLSTFETVIQACHD